VEGSGLDEGGEGFRRREQVLNKGGRTISGCAGQDKEKRASGGSSKLRRVLVRGKRGEEEGPRRQGRV
jgi:hypothetical protein